MQCDYKYPITFLLLALSCSCNQEGDMITPYPTSSEEAAFRSLQQEALDGAKQSQAPLSGYFLQGQVSAYELLEANPFMQSHERTWKALYRNEDFDIQEDDINQSREETRQLIVNSDLSFKSELLEIYDDYSELPAYTDRLLQSVYSRNRNRILQSNLTSIEKDGLIELLEVMDEFIKDNRGEILVPTFSGFSKDVAGIDQPQTNSYRCEPNCPQEQPAPVGRPGENDGALSPCAQKVIGTAIAGGVVQGLNIAWKWCVQGALASGGNPAACATAAALGFIGGFVWGGTIGAGAGYAAGKALGDC